MCQYFTEWHSQDFCKRSGFIWMSKIVAERSDCKDKLKNRIVPPEKQTLLGLANRCISLLSKALLRGKELRIRPLPFLEINLVSPSSWLHNLMIFTIFTMMFTITIVYKTVICKLVLQIVVYIYSGASFHHRTRLWNKWLRAKHSLGGPWFIPTKN